MFSDPWEPHGRALRDFFAGDASATIVVHSDLGERDEFPVSVWFRGPDEFGPMERAALDLCRGRVLDVGAGTGCHSLALQERGLSVCAIDFVPEAVEIMRRRGVREVHQANVFDFQAEPFDTILMFTNGAGIVETLAGLDRFLRSIRRLLKPDGQILLDSTDLRPGADAKAGTAGGSAAAAESLGEAGSDRALVREDGRYLGELQFQLEYRGEKAPPFAQLYVDPDLLRERAVRAGWLFEVIRHDEGGSYLARLTPAPRPRLGGCPE